MVLQQAAHEKAVAWVEAHPYQAVFMEQLPALRGDRAENAKRAVVRAKERAVREAVYFQDAKARDDFYATRKRNAADAKFCWQ